MATYVLVVAQVHSGDVQLLRLALRPVLVPAEKCVTTIMLI